MNVDFDITLDPMDVEDQDNLVFHYENVLPDGVTISSAEVTVGVHSGTDANPMQVLDGSNQVQGSTVIQPIKGTMPDKDNVYWIRCKALLSNGKYRTIPGRIRIVLMR